MEKDYALVLAWPETLCKQTGAWYDPLLNLFSVAENGYYRVGHAAVVLIDGTTKEAHYFDFGRYHAPKGYGRVRSSLTDHDLQISTLIKFRNDQIVNLAELYNEVQLNESCHGTGIAIASLVKVDFNRCYVNAISMQDRKFIKYGPFVPGGTNCSRFVNTVVRAGCKSTLTKLGLYFPVMFTPTPKWNVRVSGKMIAALNVRS